MAKTRTRLAKIVGREMTDFHARGSLLNDVPNRLLRNTLTHSLSARQTQRNKGPVMIPAADSRASSVSFTQPGAFGDVRSVPALPQPPSLAAPRPGSVRRASGFVLVGFSGKCGTITAQTTLGFSVSGIPPKPVAEELAGYHANGEDAERLSSSGGLVADGRVPWRRTACALGQNSLSTW
jgi:hypothetical protein